MVGQQPSRSKLGGALTATLALALCTASPALAAETVVNFDTLSAGTLVTNQYHAQGLEFGHAATFGQTSPGTGDCGAPTVLGDATYAPPSPPHYATLEKCHQKPGEPDSSGTYGALLDRPAGAISMYVRDLTGFAVVQVRLTSYDEAGKPVGSAQGEAGQGKWTHLTLPDPTEAKVAYFAISTTQPSGDTIAIDSLGFQSPQEKPQEKPGEGGEKPGEGGGKPGTTETTPGTSTTSKPTPPAPPTAVGTVVTPSPHAGAPVTLSGAASSPGSGQIISYEWDFNNDGKIDTSTAANPLAHVMLPTGVHTIGLTVTNSRGEKASSRFGLVLSGVNLPPPADGGEGPCLTSLEVVNAQISAECIQKKGSGGEYVIESKQLGLNGMVLAPKGGGYGVYKLQSIRHLGVGTEYRLSGTAVVIELANTPIGDMVLGGYDLETEPIDLGIEPEHRSTLKITASLRAHTADEERIHNLKGSPIMLFGVGHHCNNGSKALGCCPPPGPTKACATLPGNFPLTGQVAVYLTAKGQALFDVQVGLDLKSVNFQATGELELLSSRETGIELSTLRFTIPEASLAPIFKVKEASFVYYFPGNPDPAKRDTWQAKATVTFGVSEAGLEGELSFQQGNFHSAALKLLLPPPGIPVYPGISLNRIGASVGVEPLELGGSLGAKIASALELELAFKYSEATEQQLGFFGGRGSLAYEENVIAALEGDVYSDGYSDALLQLKISVPFGSKEPVVSVEGEIGYWDEAKTGLWEAYGRVHAKLWVIEGEIAGLVNQHYIAGCGFFGPFGALGYWDFTTSKPGGEGFVGGNCHDDLKPYKQVPLTQHSGGFVNETETELLRTPLPRSAVSARQQATIALARDPLGRDLRISSDSGIPVVTLTGPGGVSYTTPATPGKVASSGTSFISALASNPHESIVYLSSPAGGQWHLKRAPGSAPISKVEVAEVAPPAAIRASVRRRGAGWKLSYTAKNLVPGTKIRFYERGKDSIHGLATVSAARGNLTFAPTPALGRARKIYATVIAATGVPLQTLTVAGYTAPHPFRPARPRPQLRRHGHTALLSWGAVAGAKLFRVKVKGSDGRLATLFAKPSHRAETLPNVLPAESFTATVTAVGGPDMLPGPSATVRLRAVKVRHSAPKRRRRGK